MFFSISYNACAVCCFLWETKIWVKHTQTPIFLCVQNKILTKKKKKKNVCLKRHYGKLLGFWGHYTVNFSYFCLQNVFICYYCFYFLPFPDKNPWFSSQRRREGVVGMLIAALANNNGYYVLYLFPLSFSNSQLLFT